MTGRNCVIAGATGLIGGSLLNLLAEDPRWAQVTALVRRAPAGAARAADIRIVDFENLDEENLDSGIDDAFCCLGATLRKAGSKSAFARVDFAYVLAFARLALRAGAQRFALVSALGASADSPFFYNRTKGQAEAAVSELAFEAVHILRPSLLLGEREEFRLGERLATPVTRILAPLLPAALHKYRPVQAARVARQMMDACASGATGIQIHYFEEETA